jgi:hypothetical protein
MRRLAIAVLAMLAACTQSLSEDGFSVCHPLCRCTGSPLPGAQQSCTEDCMTRFARSPLGDACIACVVEHADRCATLLDDCSPVCTQPVPLASDAEGRAPGIEDVR